MNIREEIEQNIKDLQNTKDSASVSEITQKEQALSKALSKIGDAMYKNSESSEDKSKKPEDGGQNVKDADFKDVDEQK